MSRYINADALEVVCFTDREGSFSDGVQWLLEYIDGLPSADVVEVARCKDCKWFNKIGCAIKIVDESDKPHEDDFCSFAERRTDGSDMDNQKAADLLDNLVGMVDDNQGNDYDTALKMGIEALKAHTQPVQHGHWIDHTSEVFPADSTVECSVCHEHESVLLAHDNYCPNCGAKMDGKEGGKR